MMAAHNLTDEECRQAMDAYEQAGSQLKAALLLGISRSAFQNRLEVAQARGIGSTESQLRTKQGNNPEYDLDHVVPSPLVLRGSSSLYNKNGELQLQWIKTKLDDKKVEDAIRAAITTLSESLPRQDPLPKPTHVSDQLCNLYTFTDCHVGMKAWGLETGADWDLEIAEKTLISAFDYLIEASPPAASCVINQLGDFLHFDSLSAVTPEHRNLLDADTRFAKVVQVAVRILRYIINKALVRHENVIVIMAEGNHDPASSVWLRHLFSLLYENEPRVKVNNSETPYICHQHGKTMLAFHHGHLTKNDQLPLLFAAQYPIEWGSTTRRYCHVGHRHHVDEKEHSGMKVQQHATLAARDAYAARGGWIADRQIEAITYHSEYGQVGSITVVPEMLE